MRGAKSGGQAQHGRRAAASDGYRGPALDADFLRVAAVVVVVLRAVVVAVALRADVARAVSRAFADGAALRAVVAGVALRAIVAGVGLRAAFADVVSSVAGLARDCRAGAGALAALEDVDDDAVRAVWLARLA